MEEVWLLIFSALGLLISYYIWYKKRHKEKLTCYIGKDCEKVVLSKYRKMLGIENEILGMIYFSFIFLIGILMFIIPEFFSLNYIVLGKIIISGAAALFSTVLAFIQLIVLKELCEYCLAASFLSIAIFIVII